MLGCIDCPDLTFSPIGSYGASACKHKRPCQVTDVDVSYTKCVKGQRTMTLKWSMISDSIFEELVCDPNHLDSFAKKLPDPTIVECTSCGIG